MAWNTPKTDWATDDAVGTTDLNRIEANTEYLKGSKGADVASAQNLDIGAGSFFYVTGSTKIERILKTGRQAGEVIYLQFQAGCAIDYNTANSGEYAATRTNYADRTTGVEAVYAVLFDGTYWNFLASL